MCPVCIGAATATWLASGGTSAGGLAALVVIAKRHLRRFLPTPVVSLTWHSRSCLDRALTGRPGEKRGFHPLVLELRARNRHRHRAPGGQPGAKQDQCERGKPAGTQTLVQ
jgi:hypothetical protein